MKRVLATLLALTLMVTVAASAALAEGSAAPTFTAGVQFNMDMDQVMNLVNLPNPEIDRERTSGAVEFWELDYEHVNGGDGINVKSFVTIEIDIEEVVKLLEQLINDRKGE